MVAMAKFYLDFTVEESCGKCAPCRIGNKRLHEILQKITSGNGAEEIEITKEHPNVKVTFKLKMGVVTTKPQIIKIENI